MGKRGVDSDEDRDYDEDLPSRSVSEKEQLAREELVKKPRSKQSKQKPTDKATGAQSGQRTAKKPRLSSDDEDGESPVKTAADGRKYIDLGKKKRATISEFKGTVYLDIREYYEQGGDLKPGKKGISISYEQWSVLRSNAATIDVLFTKANKN